MRHIFFFIMQNDFTVKKEIHFKDANHEIIIIIYPFLISSPYCLQNSNVHSDSLCSVILLCFRKSVLHSTFS